MTSKHPNSPVVHFTTPAEAILMDAIDIVINSHQAGEVQPLIDFDFLRDYAVASLRNHFQQQGVRSYTRFACACVYASHDLYHDRNIAQLIFKKISSDGNFR